MGKTLKRQRQRQLKEQQQHQQQQQQQQGHVQLPKIAGMPAVNAGSSSSKFTFVVSACMQAQNWLGALQTLQAMAVLKKVPKLGAVQRWVREADQAGDDSVTAKLIDAVLRCTMPSSAASHSPAVANVTAAGHVEQNGSSKAAPFRVASSVAELHQGRITRHPPWSPVAAPAAVVAAAAAAPTALAAAAAAAAAPADCVHSATATESKQLMSFPSAAAAKAAAAAANSNTQQQQHADYARLLYQVPFQPGAGGPTAIHAFPPHTVQLDLQHLPVTAAPVPFVPGAVLLQNVLSAWECQQIMTAAESIGYSLDVDYTFGGATGDDGLEAAAAAAGDDGPAAAAAPAAAGEDGSAAAAAAAAGEDGLAATAAPAESSAVLASADPVTKEAEQASQVAQASGQPDGGSSSGRFSNTAAVSTSAAAAAAKSAARGLAAAAAGLPAAAGGPAAGCVWLADDSLLTPVYDRVRHLLPQELDGGALAGLNARWRLYRYTPGNVYRPHVDGAWPGSGVDQVTGQYLFDAFGDRWSRLTFLVYLNDGFEGGHTTFYTPSAEEGVLDARGVLPRRGCVLVFPHGGAVGSLVHEGSAVVKGSKYVIRTDVLYMKTESGRQRQLKQGQHQLQQQPHKRMKRQS